MSDKFRPQFVEIRGKLLKNTTSAAGGTLELELEHNKQQNQSDQNVSWFSGGFRNNASSCVLIFKGQDKGFRLERLESCGNVTQQRTKPLAWSEQTTQPPIHQQKAPSNPTHDTKDTSLRNNRTERSMDSQRDNRHLTDLPPSNTRVKASSNFPTIPRPVPLQEDFQVPSMLPSVVTSDNEASSDDEFIKDLEQQMLQDDMEENPTKKQKLDSIIEEEFIDVLPPQPMNETFNHNSSTTNGSGLGAYAASSNPPQPVGPTSPSSSSSSSSSDSDSSSSSSDDDDDQQQQNQ